MKNFTIKLFSLISVILGLTGASAGTYASAPASEPFSIAMTINGDTKSRMAFAWFTDTVTTKGYVQIFSDLSDPDSDTPEMEIKAESKLTTQLQYANDMNPVPKSMDYINVVYMSHKAVAEGLEPGTHYRYRVGTEGAWSKIGEFTTAPENTEEYSFIYITDTQANDDKSFDISQTTVHSAAKAVPDAAFVVCNGDLVNSTAKNSSEWEWQQWFSTMQDVWMEKPLAITMGNHDANSHFNFAWHFNNDDSYNDTSHVKTMTAGTTFSFVWGDALFMVMNTVGESDTEDYLKSLSDWMEAQVAANPDTKWRIVCCHNGLFSGGSTHQDESAAVMMRQILLPTFGRLNIDLALQGHDHIYQVIGPVDSETMTVVPNSTNGILQISEGGTISNMTGKSGGEYDVTHGTLYFLNGAAGEKEYNPRSRQEMEDAFEKHHVENYWNLFTGKLSRVGMPTFSKFTVNDKKLSISTFAVDESGTAEPFDSISVVKEIETGNSSAISNDNRIDLSRPYEVYGIDGVALDPADQNLHGLMILCQGQRHMKVIR